MTSVRTRDVASVPGELEDAQEASAAKHRHAERLHELGLREDSLDDAAEHDERVEAIEERHEVTLQPKHKRQHTTSA